MQALGDFRRGGISVNFRKCGKANCRCADPDHPGHGPQYLWNATIGGQSRARNLRLGPELQKVGREVEAYRRFVELCRELVEVNEQICGLRPVEEVEEEALDQLKKNCAASTRRSRSRDREGWRMKKSSVRMGIFVMTLTSLSWSGTLAAPPKIIWGDVELSDRSKSPEEIILKVKLTVDDTQGDQDPVKLIFIPDSSLAAYLVAVAPYTLHVIFDRKTVDKEVTLTFRIPESERPGRLRILRVADKRFGDPWTFLLGELSVTLKPDGGFGTRHVATTRGSEYETPQ